ncbi:MAG: rhodanese-related sulfurtransferase [Flavobacteriales bacterium]|nr:rhodanese-related sulfurtransferase [Flavobacteriales bacterium]
MQLYNKMSAEERRILIKEAGEKRLTLSFYQYHHIQNPKFFRDKLFLDWNALGVLGRTYVASEGINAQISVPAQRFEEFRKNLNEITFLKDIRLNVAIEQDDLSFLKLTIKIRPKIVADGLDDSSFDVTDCGVHVDAKTFNELSEDPDTIILDMRNHYESEVGHFEGAVTPDVDTFRESLPIIEEELADCKEEKKLLMYCTGGIRCEKASAYFKHKGFKQVYQLEGGIIEYTRKAQELGLDNRFKGKNFVFDERKAERISDDVIAVCHQCGTACDEHINCANAACHLLFIQCPDCAKKFHQTCSEECAHIVQLPEEEQAELRKGKSAGKAQFNKGRSDALRYKKPKDASIRASL